MHLPRKASALNKNVARHNAGQCGKEDKVMMQTLAHRQLQIPLRLQVFMLVSKF